MNGSGCSATLSISAATPHPERFPELPEAGLQARDRRRQLDHHPVYAQPVGFGLYDGFKFELKISQT